MDFGTHEQIQGRSHWLRPFLSPLGLRWPDGSRSAHDRPVAYDRWNSLLPGRHLQPVEAVASNGVLLPLPELPSAVVTDESGRGI
jgi:hypothetical protein